MDALTNVVAVLILVLILVQADVTQKVQKFLDDLLPATPEEVAQSKQHIKDLQQRLLVTQARLRDEPPTPAEIEEEKRQIALLEKSMEDTSNLLAELEQLRHLEKKIREQRDLESDKTIAIQKEIAKLEAMLDETPTIKPDTPTVVNIPNSRPIPEDAVISYGIAWNDRIHIIDPTTPLKLFNRELERNRSKWSIQRIKRKGTDAFVYDREKIEKHFKDFDWKNPQGQKVELSMPPTSTIIRLIIRLDLEKGGTPMEELGQPNNAFAKAVAALKRDFDSVLMFRVHPSSFNAYLRARELIDKVNIPAGWEMNWHPHYVTVIPDAYVQRTVEPPPKPAVPPKPGPPPPPKPPPLKPKLD